MPALNIERNNLIVILHRDGLSHAEIARRLNISRERVRQILVDALGHSKPIKQQPAYRRDQAIAAYLALESGLSVEDIANQLEISTDRVDRLLAEGIGVKRHVLAFRQWMSEQIGQKYGSWLVLAIEPITPTSTSKARCRVKARCTKCDTIHTVIYSNLSSGCSTMCVECGRKSLQHRCKPVQDNMTGNIYSSIQEASKVLGLTYNQARYRARSPKNLPGLTPVSTQSPDREHRKLGPCDSEAR